MFVALGIQHAMRIRDSVICGLPGCTIFFHIISQQRDVREENFKQEMCGFCLEILPEIFLALRRIKKDMIKNICWFHVKWPLFLSDFNENRVFMTDFQKIVQYQIS